MLEQIRRHTHIDPTARPVEHHGTQLLEDKIEKDRQRNASGESHQRGYRKVGDHPVIDIHDKQRECQAEHIDDERGDDDLQP